MILKFQMMLFIVTCCKNSYFTQKWLLLTFFPFKKFVIITVKFKQNFVYQVLFVDTAKWNYVQ